MELSESGDKRPNFSALTPNTNATIVKMPINGLSKPGDVKKLIIKNFKGKKKHLQTKWICSFSFGNFF